MSNTRPESDLSFSHPCYPSRRPPTPALRALQNYRLPVELQNLLQNLAQKTDVFYDPHEEVRLLLATLRGAPLERAHAREGELQTQRWPWDWRCCCCLMLGPTEKVCCLGSHQRFRPASRFL